MVGSGRSLLDPLAAAAVIDRLRCARPAAGPLAGLTDHERTTLDLIGEGLSNRQIAERMFVAEKTVKNYVSHVLAKLGMASRTQVAVLATQVRDHTAGAGLTAGSLRQRRGPGQAGTTVVTVADAE
jgi:DNA-binding NarL/FixJ family response regulator